MEFHRYFIGRQLTINENRLRQTVFEMAPMLSKGETQKTMCSIAGSEAFEGNAREFAKIVTYPVTGEGLDQYRHDKPVYSNNVDDHKSLVLEIKEKIEPGNKPMKVLAEKAEKATPALPYSMSDIVDECMQPLLIANDFLDSAYYLMNGKNPDDGKDVLVRGIEFINRSVLKAVDGVFFHTRLFNGRVSREGRGFVGETFSDFIDSKLSLLEDFADEMNTVAFNIKNELVEERVLGDLSELSLTIKSKIPALPMMRRNWAKGE